MIPYLEAKEIITSTTPHLAEEGIDLTCASGRILAQELRALIPSPPFTNSAMDGFAFRHADLEMHPELDVIATVRATQGEGNSIPRYQPGGCVKIMTGAVVPSWADTVVRIESTSLSDHQKLQFKGSVPEIGSNIRKRGDDLPEGQLVMRSGTLLKPEHIMVAAALGYDCLKVFERPRLAFLSTGDELTEVGRPLPFGGVYNSSKYFLLNAARELGITPATVTTIPDSLEAAEKFISNFCTDGRATIIVSTGAVSMGEADFIPTLAAELGFEAHFHRIAIRPGKPAFFATRNNVAWLGLPGNPISTAIGWHILARPLLARWMNCSESHKTRLILKNEVKKPEELRCYFRAEINNGKAWVARRQGSADLAASVTCSAYVELPEGVGRFAPDTPVDAIII